MARFGKGFMRYIMVLECVALTLFSFLLCPAEAYSYDERYLDYVNWQGEEVESVVINNPDVDGSTKYFSKGTSVYFLFDMYGEDITSKSKISITFEVSCESGEYEFDLCNSGNEFYNGSEKYFNGKCQSNSNDTGQIIAITMIDVNDKIYLHDFRIRAYIDGKNKLLTKNKSLTIATAPPPTTTKVTTTRAKTTKQTTTKKSTTAKSSTTAKNKSEKSSSTQKVTKFKAPEDFEESTTADTTDNEEALDSEYEYEQAEAGEKHLSKKSKILLAIAISLITIGLAFAILYYFLIQKKDKDTDNKSENDLH